MKISVIVPLYYGKKYIEAILDMMQRNLKIAKSSYELEIILVNDAPDETIELKDISDRAPIEVKLIFNDKNRGIHFSRVEGLKHATGKYVMFFDQDDEIADNYFESQLSHIGKGDVVVANGVAKYKDYDKLLYRYSVMQWTVKHSWFYAQFDCRIISPGQCLIRIDSVPQVWKEKILINNGADDYFLWLVMLKNKIVFKLTETFCIHIYIRRKMRL